MSSKPTNDRGSIAAWVLALRSGLLQSWRSAALLAAMFGTVAGIAVASLTMADRVESSYDKLLVETDAPDLAVFCEGCPGPTQAGVVTEGPLSDPAISHVAVLNETYPIMYTADGELLGPFESECESGAGELSATPASWARSETPLVRVTSGRLPAPNSPNEVALPAITAQRAGVQVGDDLFVTGACNKNEGDVFKPQTLSVVGIFVGFMDVRPPGQAEYFEVVLVDPTFAPSIGIQPQPGTALVWFAEGADVGDLGDEVSSFFTIDIGDHARVIGDRLRPDATALRILAALGALAAIAVLGQLLARHLRLLGSDHSTLRALGTTRRGLWLLGLGHGAFIGLAAGVICAAAALVALPLVPPGAGEGVLLGTEGSISMGALALSVVVTIGVIVLLAVIPSQLAARAYLRRGGLGRQSMASRIVGSGRLGTTPSWGVRLALEPAGGANPVPVRSGLGAAVIATAVVAGAITFVSGLQHLRETPRLVGSNWDFFASGGDIESLGDFAAEHPDIERSSLGTFFPSSLSLGGLDFEVYDIAFDSGAHAVTPVVVIGRAPQGSDEILINADLADRLEVEVGDEVSVLAEDSFASLHDVLGVERDIPDGRQTSFELVGLGVLPIPDGRFELGVSLTLDGIRRIFEPASRDEMIQLLLSVEPTHLHDVLVEFEFDELAAEIEGALPDDTAAVIAGWTDEQLASFSPTEGADGVYVDVVDGADTAALATDLIESGLLGDEPFVYGMSPDGTLATTTELVALDLDDVAWIPAGMGILMGLTALAVLAHLIATGARARRRDIATLRALGLVGRQARAIVAWQAMTLVVVTAVIALPIGVVAGRYAWRTYAEGLGVVAEPVTPWLSLAVLLAGLVVAHLLASLLPGRAAARMRPVESLRSE
ncbi:MAG: FtsX-like permease family protein [Ilumatobacteraceae bacterium]